MLRTQGGSGGGLSHSGPIWDVDREAIGIESVNHCKVDFAIPMTCVTLIKRVLLCTVRLKRGSCHLKMVPLTGKPFSTIDFQPGEVYHVKVRTFSTSTTSE